MANSTWHMAYADTHCTWHIQICTIAHGNTDKCMLSKVHMCMHKHTKVYNLNILAHVSKIGSECAHVMVHVCSAPLAPN